MHSFQDTYDWLSAFVAMFGRENHFLKNTQKLPKITDNFREIKRVFQKYSESSWEFQIHDDENRKKNR